MGKDIIITGGDGFIGSHLAKYLSEVGYSVYALVMPNSSTKFRIEGLNNVHAIECDLERYETVIENLPKHPKAFFHFAWAGVTPDSRKSLSIQKGNISLSLKAVELAKAVQAEKFIFPGSTMEFSFSGKAINRDTAPSPQNAYGSVKIATKYLCEEMCREYSISFIYIVISGIYSEDRKDNNVIYYAISSLLKNEIPRLTKLEQLWDYVHINDVVDAMLRIVECGKNGGFYPIGHGDNWPLANYIFMIRDIINPNAKLAIGDVPYDSNVLPMSCVDMEETKYDLGYSPKIDFKTGISLVINKVKESLQ